MWSELKPGLLMMVAITLLTGLVYPALVTGVAQIVFHDQANGSLLIVNGQVIGSRLIAQNFSRPEYFHPRPSSAGPAGYDPTATGGSNLGPTSAKLLNGTTRIDEQHHEVVDFDGIKLRVVRYCLDNGIPVDSSTPLDDFRGANGELDDVRLIKAFNDDRSPLTITARTPIPADAVTASASGIDPHISPRNAELQAARVAKARGIDVHSINEILAQHTEGRTLGLFGEPRVNVLELNLALDARFIR